MKMKLGLLYGGKSAEHEVSLRTAMAVLKALDLTKFQVYPIYISKDGYFNKGKELTEPVSSVDELKFTVDHSNQPFVFSSHVFTTETNEKLDCIFPLLHGPNGEDGTVQGLLELLNLPYVGNGVLASSAGMDKIVMKNIFDQCGLPQVAYTYYIKSKYEENKEAVYLDIEEKLKYPVFIKPANLGSSVGISKATNRETLIQAIDEAFLFDRRIIVEQGVVAREIEIAVLGNDEPKVSVAGEILPKKEFYDYNSKYEDKTTGLEIPAAISKEQYEQMEEMAIRAFKALDCSGLVRADFFLDKEGNWFINEVNTMPGFTPVSMYPLLWTNTGLSYSNLIEELVELALQKHRAKQKIKYTME